jgi:hypothetical protein
MTINVTPSMIKNIVKAMSLDSLASIRGIYNDKLKEFGTGATNIALYAVFIAGFKAGEYDKNSHRKPQKGGAL